MPYHILGTILHQEASLQHMMDIPSVVRLLADRSIGRTLHLPGVVSDKHGRYLQWLALYQALTLVWQSYEEVPAARAAWLVDSLSRHERSR